MRGGVSRKGSMQLSIEAIIVLVIAMVLLGLAITFIRGFFDKAAVVTDKPFTDLDFGCNVDSRNPISVSPSNPVVDEGDQLELEICVYGGTEATAAEISFRGCSSTDVAASSRIPDLVTQSTAIPRLGVGRFNPVMIARDAADPTTTLPRGTYVCTLEAVTETSVSLGSRQVVITVT